MNRVSKLSLASVAVLSAALFVMAPASGAPENPRNIKARSLIGNNDMGYFTPAAADPRLAAAYARGGLNNQGFRFTPVGADRNRAVTVAVRANGGAKSNALVMGDVPAVSGMAAAPALGVQPVSYSLGAAVGWKKFALTGEADRVDIGALSKGTEKTSITGSAAKKWSSRVQVSADRSLGQAPRTLTGSDNLGLDLGGSYRLTRNLDVTAGVRYKSERDRLQQVDDRRDSQAVYVGTAFRF